MFTWALLCRLGVSHFGKGVRVCLWSRQSWIALTMLSTVECVRFALQHWCLERVLLNLHGKGWEWQKRRMNKGREVCVLCMCVLTVSVFAPVNLPLCVFLCCTKFRGPDSEKVKDLNEVEREGERQWSGKNRRQRSDRKREEDKRTFLEGKEDQAPWNFCGEIVRCFTARVA